MIGSDIHTFGSDQIRVSDQIRLNPYPIHIHSKKSDFIHIHIHYPVNGFFYCLTGSDRVGNPRIRIHLPSLNISQPNTYLMVQELIIHSYTNIYQNSKILIHVYIIKPKPQPDFLSKAASMMSRLLVRSLYLKIISFDRMS